MQKLRVAVLFGGISPEHEISCVSAAAIIDNMPRDSYEVIMLGITKAGHWLLYQGDTPALRGGAWECHPACLPAFIPPSRQAKGLLLQRGACLEFMPIDIVFPVLHGQWGEDGTLQGLLEMAGLAYVGCGVLASATCMDKAAANRLFDANGIAHTPWLAMQPRQLQNMPEVLRCIDEKMTYPIFVKPALGGSSVGVSKVQQPGRLPPAIALALMGGGSVLFEQAVQGQEVECAVLGNEEPIASLPGEIISCNEVYDYAAKYESGNASQLLLPANLPRAKLEEVRALALRAFTALGCAGLARVDFFVQAGSGKVLINEINTMPGFTPISMYPKLMQEMGITFPQLIQRLLSLAQERARA